MKRLFLTLLVFVGLCAVVPAHAQLRFGLKGGLNISKVTFSQDILKGDNQTGFFIGPMAEFTLPVIGIGVDVAALYNQVGAKAKAGVLTVDETMKSIEVPLNLKWTLGLGSMLGAYVAAGPQFGFNVGNGHFSEAFDMKTCYTTFNVGAGVKLLGHLQAGLNYNFGISNLAKKVDSNLGSALPDAQADMKRNTWQISLAYMF